MAQGTPRQAAPDNLAGFDLTVFFAGRTTAWGIFEDRFGRLRRHFRIELDGRWIEDQFQLDERFSYNEGDREDRRWMVTPLGRGRFTATCPDCVGQADGQFDAQTIRMRYKFRLPIGGRTIVVSFDDRIHLIGAELAVNRATVSKWGVRLGEVSVFFRREPGSQELAKRQS